MNADEALCQAAAEVLVHEQHRLEPGQAVAIVFAVWFALSTSARPAKRIRDRWKDPDLDLAARLHRDLYVRAAQLAGLAEGWADAEQGPQALR